MTSNSVDAKKLEEGDGVYHLENDEIIENEEAIRALSRRMSIVGYVTAAAFAIALILVMVSVNNSRHQDNTIYTIDTSKYGIPDECDENDGMIICAEDPDVGNVKCSCGDGLVYEWNSAEYGDEWVQVSN